MSVVPESLSKSVQELGGNGAYFDGLIQWFDGQIAASQTGQPIQPLLVKSHKYVEDSLGSIADNIVNCAGQLTALVNAQAEELEQVTQRLASVSTRLTQADSIAAASFHRQLNAPRQIPKRRLKLRVLTGDELPSLARPKAKYTHAKIDLTYLEHVGISGNMDFVPQTITRQTSTLNLPQGYEVRSSSNGSTASHSHSNSLSSIGGASSTGSGSSLPPVAEYDDAPPLMSKARPTASSSDGAPPSLASFRAMGGGTMHAAPAAAPVAPMHAPPMNAPPPSAPAFAPPPPMGVPPPSAYAPVSAPPSPSQAPPLPTGHRPSLSSGGGGMMNLPPPGSPPPAITPRPRGSFSQAPPSPNSAPGAPPMHIPPPSGPPPPGQAQAGMLNIPPPAGPPPMMHVPPPAGPPPPGHRPSLSGSGGPPPPVPSGHRPSLSGSMAGGPPPPPMGGRPSFSGAALPGMPPPPPQGGGSQRGSMDVGALPPPPMPPPMAPSFAAPPPPGPPSAPGFGAPPPPGPPGPPGPPSMGGPPPPGPPGPPGPPSAPGAPSFAPSRAAAPAAAGAGGRGALLASIQAGRGLKKVAKPVERNEFVKPAPGAAAEPPKPKGPMSMADEMAARLAKRKG